MLPYKNRLIKKEDFGKVHRQGRFFCLENIAIKTGKNKLGVSRIGFSVGLNFSKKAVERNRIKRQLRGIFQKYLNEIKKGMDIVVIARKENKGNKEENQKELSEVIRIILGKSGLINDKK